jgi:hypothetical protein
VLTFDRFSLRPGVRRRIRARAGRWPARRHSSRMVSEGVDIPRLRVGVYATATTTDLFFRQAVGRFVRWQHGIRHQRAWLYVPDDPRVRAWAGLITKQRRHSLARDMSRHPGVSNGRATSLADSGANSESWSRSALPNWTSPLLRQCLRVIGSGGDQTGISVHPVARAWPPPTAVYAGQSWPLSTGPSELSAACRCRLAGLDR